MSVTVALFGGPLDGTEVALSTTPWAPPLTLRLPIAMPMSAFDGPPPRRVGPPALDPGPLMCHIYERRRSTLEYGPAWRYVYRRTE